MNKQNDMTLKEAKIAINYLEKMIQAKKEQIKNEPEEIMWKNELRQLYGSQELIKMDLECLEN